MKNYHRFYSINADPEEVYSALVKPLSLELWTGFPAVMEEEPGTEFSLFDGDISGVNMEFIPGKKIVQEWFFGNQTEKSVVTITLTPDKNKTKVELHHANIPDDAIEDIKEGWDSYYFGALKKFFR